MRDLAVGLERVEAYVDRHGLRGWDPYDALRSPLFRLPLLRSAKPPRLVAQQALRRLPVNVRPLLGIPRGTSPVTAAWVARAHASLALAHPEHAEEHRARAAAAVTELERLSSSDWSGACWGYEFDWETRYARIPAGVPTVVATGLVTSGLFAVWELLGHAGARRLCESAADFVLRDLNRHVEPDGSLCWSYSPLDRERVVNATLLGGRLCAQAHTASPSPELREAALATARFALAAQREDGSWPYAVGDARAWTDHFHTAYVVDCLDEIGGRLDDADAVAAARRGYAYYRERLFTPDLVPRYYDTRTSPLDAQACAQAVLTLSRFGDVDAARRVGAVAVERLQNRDGSFAYRRGRLLVNRIAYMRWSTAPMLCALAHLALEESRA